MEKKRERIDGGAKFCLALVTGGKVTDIFIDCIA
jgi:hypothetical protein